MSFCFNWKNKKLKEFCRISGIDESVVTERAVEKNQAEYQGKLQGKSILMKRPDQDG